MCLFGDQNGEAETNAVLVPPLPEWDERNSVSIRLQWQQCQQHQHHSQDAGPHKRFFKLMWCPVNYTSVLSYSVVNGILILISVVTAPNCAHQSPVRKCPLLILSLWPHCLHTVRKFGNRYFWLYCQLTYCHQLRMKKKQVWILLMCNL